MQLIENISLPSIIEGLQTGIRGRKIKDETTLTDGFDSKILKDRHTVLSFQHRMHPDISDLPRNLFYDNNALQDAGLPSEMSKQRAWAYPRYPKRRVWINVDGQLTKLGSGGRKNEPEAKELMEEIESFVKWAKQNPKPNNSQWDVACLTFYRGQEACLKDMLQKYCSMPNSISRFKKDGVEIKLYTVDKFQGQEADVVFLSMVQVDKDGFLDSPNRLNVAITRARFQLVIFGKHDYFKNRSRSDELQELAKQTIVFNS